jgi:hypothetical protein
MLTDYTTYNDLRAALGVSSTDLPDEVLSLNLYELMLKQEFDAIDLTLESTYITTEELTAPTAAEMRFLSATDLFATYAVAKHLTASLPMFSFRQMTDGKAQGTRFDNPYKDTIAYVMSQYDTAKTKLVEAFAAVGTVTTTTVAKSYFAVISPSTDPVTGTV